MFAASGRSNAAFFFALFCAFWGGKCQFYSVISPFFALSPDILQGFSCPIKAAKPYKSTVPVSLGLGAPYFFAALRAFWGPMPIIE